MRPVCASFAMRDRGDSDLWITRSGLRSYPQNDSRRLTERFYRVRSAAHIQSKEVVPVSGFRVTPQQLTSMGSTCNRTAADVRGQHTVLKGQLSPLFGTEWSGTAAAQFTELYEQFNTNALGMTEALDGIGRLLAQAGQSYASVEQQIASSFRR